ncbi:MAG: type III-B CRISPR module RAMP protein Cmr1 [Desulfobacteraceae bacterium]|nr:MAG: type III-B CRISPR module RAMP protein Cmr1 [Desulfobacteraceae bacterium]
MTQLSAHFRVVTPLFLGGADNKTEAELRPASIKGTLRFWWRTLQWGKGVTDVGNLKKKEDRLFGSSEGGQAKILLMVTPDSQPNVIPPGNILNKQGNAGIHRPHFNPLDRNQNVPNAVEEGARYMGYGLMAAFPSMDKDKKTKEIKGVKAYGGELTRPCIAAPFEFSVRLAFKPDVAETEVAEIANALKLLGLCGGLGSRSRRGWGSVSLTQLSNSQDGADEEIWRAPKTIEGYQAKITEIVGYQKNKDAGAGAFLPKWTAFAAGHSKVVLLQDNSNSPLEALAKMGKDFVFFRGWGHNGKVLGEPREGNFPYDHDLFKRIPPRNRNTEHPQRIVFGLPQNYGRFEQDQVIPADTGPKDKWLTRRASPLFFHVHQAGDGDAPIGVLTYLPAIFLPGEKNTVKFGGSLVPLGQNGGVDFWKPAEDFLKRIMSADRRHPVTPPLKASNVQFKKTLEVNI